MRPPLDVGGAYMAGFFASPPWPTCPGVSNWITIFFALLWAATNIGIAKLTPEVESPQAERLSGRCWWGPPGGSPPC